MNTRIDTPINPSWPAAPPPHPPVADASDTTDPPTPNGLPTVTWYRQPKANPSRVPSWLVTAALVALAAGLLLGGVGAAGALLLGFVILTPIERIWRRHDQPIRRPGLRTDMFHLLLTGALTTVCAFVPILFWSVVLSPIIRFGPAGALHSLPGAAQAVLAFAALELFAYLAHRALHEVPFFWRFHSVHHSSQRMDWIAGARNHPMDAMIAGSLIAAPILMLGVGSTTLGAFTVITQLSGLLLHMNVRWRLRRLDGIWSTTDFHHWHHSNQPEARNRNYSGFLPIFDKLFGTYYMPKDARPQVYGIDEPMPDGWSHQIRQPFRRRPTRVTAF